MHGNPEAVKKESSSIMEATLLIKLQKWDPITFALYSWLEVHHRPHPHSRGGYYTQVWLPGDHLRLPATLGCSQACLPLKLNTLWINSCLGILVLGELLNHRRKNRCKLERMIQSLLLFQTYSYRKWVELMDCQWDFLIYQDQHPAQSLTQRRPSVKTVCMNKLKFQNIA